MMPTPSKAFIDARWTQLYELEKEFGLDIINYLFITNTGGAVATLSFIGAVGKNNIAFGVKLALVSFVLGIVLTGCYKIGRYHNINNLFTNWRKVGEQNPNMGAIQEVDARLSRTGFWVYVLGYGAFFCFVGGAVMGCTIVF